MIRKKEEEIMFQKVTEIGFDSKRDAILYNYKVNRKCYASTTFGDVYVITGEPGN